MIWKDKLSTVMADFERVKAETQEALDGREYNADLAREMATLEYDILRLRVKGEGSA